jgi:hypothetical protein
MFLDLIYAFRIGDTVKLSVEPATFPDLRTPHPLSIKDAKANDATASRHFFLDVKSPAGLLLRTVEGESTKSARYTFTIPVEATFGSIGVNVLSFRYKPAHGPEIHLQNFDSTVGELYEGILAAFLLFLLILSITLPRVVFSEIKIEQ